MDEYRYFSIRARKARLGRVFKHPLFRFFSALLIFLGLLAGPYFIFLAGEKVDVNVEIFSFSLDFPLEKSSAGWLFLAGAALLFMLKKWAKSDLRHIPVGRTEDINDILSANVMKALGRAPTPVSFAKNLYKTHSGSFLALRFGLSREFLVSVAEQLPADLKPIFSRAREIRRETDSEVISGNILALALLETHPSFEQILRQLKLERADLIDGINWYNRLYGNQKDLKLHRRDGGIARDFSFGYIPNLSKFGTNISQLPKTSLTKITPKSHQEIIEKMCSAFSKGGRQNIALVGAEGSGRTTILNAFAETLMDGDAKLPASLKYRQIFVLDATSLISAAGGRGELEELVTLLLNEAYAAKNIIVCLDNAELFFEENVGSVDLSNVLLPILDAGRLRLIFTMEEQKYLEISARNSSLANKLNKVMVSPATKEETLCILEDNLLLLESKYDVLYQYLALGEAYRLSERYIHDLVMPGRALSLLESATSYAENRLVTPNSVHLAIEKTQGVRLASSGEVAEKEKLLNLESLIHERMIDQVEAVRTVSDALRRAGAGVRNENKPIGTFLFLGPTGVGKTELAKTLGEVYFNGENSLIRLDMNEFVSESDVARLLEEGKDNSESLTARVAKQPFSVVLFDEIEKAHPAVLTTLLQLLDEGILRDAKNREVSFRDTIVIATSNAGANKIREAVEAGREMSAFKEELTNSLIESGEFKPEFLNRFDEICLFTPLEKPELRKIADLIIASVNKTLSPQKISVEVDDEAKDLLVERGYDPKMGARPMRRVIQKTVENLVARTVLEGSATSGTTIKITKDQL